MHIAGQAELDKTSLDLLGRLEIGAGVAFTAISLLMTTARKFDLGLQLDGAFALMPLLLIFGGAVFVIVGSSVRKFPQYVYLAHVPLVLWLGVVTLTFL